jgi:major vault protein
MIQYDGKYMHHAIAIPEGEGRYILNRLTGEIKTIKGPQMYLPDPRTEVVVKRKLTTKECQLLYPGNTEVLEYNHSLNEKVTEKLARKGGTNAVTDAINGAYSTSNQLDTLAIFEANANISRGVSYTKPRTITLDTKYDGVVAVNVWTGYAINVVSKTGDREVIVGPMTRLLDYDETLESMELSTGNPKTTDRLLNTAYLRVENNKVSDIIGGQTKDFVDVNVKVSYCVNFLEEYKNKWFSVDNYVKFLTDRMRSMVKKEIKKYTIQEFYANSTDIVRNLVLDINRNTEDNGADEKKYTGRVFIENGMNVVDVEVLAVHVDRKIANLIEAHQTEMIEKTLELTDAEARMKVITALADVDRKKSELENANALYELSLNQKLAQERFAREEEMREKQRVAKEAEKRAEADMQKILDAIQAAELARKKATVDAEIARQKELAEIEKAKQTAYAQTIEKIMSSVTPDLIAALSTKANAELFSEAAKNIGPYAIAGNESISDTVNKLMRGTPIEGILEKFKVAE